MSDTTHEYSVLEVVSDELSEPNEDLGEIIDLQGAQWSYYTFFLLGVGIIWTWYGCCLRRTRFASETNLLNKERFGSRNALLPTVLPISGVAKNAP